MQHNIKGSVDLAAMRQEYAGEGIDRTSLPGSPFDLWEVWLAEAVAADLPEPNAMVLATVARPEMVGQPYQPSSRVVLCKKASTAGFEFFTNYQSRKSEEIKASGTLAATFPWIALQRQVNIVGTAEQMSAQDSDTYWSSRDRGSQLGAWASAQSTDIDSYNALEDRYRNFDTKYPHEVPRPPHWGGWRIVPSSVEFWQGRSNRLHDRMVYRHSRNDQWSLHRLSP